MKTRAPGLRVQIVLALAGLMVLAFVPLFFAVASLTRATLQGAREEAARGLGRAIAAHVGDARALPDRAALTRILESHMGEGGAAAIGIYDAQGRLEASAGDRAEVGSMTAPMRPYREATATAHGGSGRVLEIVVPREDVAVVARIRTDDDADRAAPLVRLVGLYMATFAMALLVFAYFSLTRVIVRPVEALVRAADRVAKGSRTLTVPRAGASELAALGASVQAMTTRVLADEEAMRLKVEELTQTTNRLTEAQSQLARSERLASVGRLSAGLAHEIGNPIAAIMGMEDLLLEGGLSPEEQRDFLERMKRETQRIHEVLRDLLDFARPEAVPPAAPSWSGPIAADVEGEGETVESVVGEVVALLTPQKAWKGIRLETDITQDGACAALSPKRLTQVLLNLLMNAGSALSARGGGKVTVRARRDGPQIRIEVEDDGPGIPEALRSSIFEPFVTTKEVGEGTGLGLAVCRGLVESAGGRITLDASYEGGARFVLVLPGH